MKKGDILRRLKDQAFCRIQPSESHGVGVFAIKEIPAHISPWVTSNHHLGDSPHFISNQDLKKLDLSIKDMLLDYNLKENQGVYISPHELEMIHITQFLNASKNPNLDFLFDTTGEFVTNREIKAGEELTVDYQKSLQNTSITYNHPY